MKDQKYLLTAEDLKEIGKSYTVMSPFIKKASKIIVRNSSMTDYKFTATGMGRTRIGEKLYKGESPLKFYNSSGTLASKELRRELLIREFFRQGPIEADKRLADKTWLSDKIQDTNYRIWKAGETGYPLIDAGMAQLADEGWMPNRVRMICASFLTKNLGVHWQRGESYFASKLVDYNKYSNLGNWLWISGAAFNTRVTDVMSPDLQLLKFDSKCLYVNGILGTKYKSAREAISTQNPSVEYQKSKERYLRNFSDWNRNM